MFVHLTAIGQWILYDFPHKNRENFRGIKKIEFDCRLLVFSLLMAQYLFIEGDSAVADPSH